MKHRSSCSVQGCKSKHYGLGFCQPHYVRFKAYGDPLAGKAPRGAMQAYVEDVAIFHVGDECLLLPFRRSGTGYGNFKSNGKRLSAHRLVCELAHGDPPSKNHEAAHSCGNRWCVSPHHLRWATSKENHSDRIIHGTHLRGVNSPNAKISEEIAAEIIGLKGTVTQKSLAMKYGMSQATISKIQLGKSWSWLRPTELAAGQTK